MNFRIILLTYVIMNVGSTFVFDESYSKVLLKNVSAITKYAGRMTTWRRVSPINQINCIGGSAAGMYVSLTIQCMNRGWDGNDVQWECVADLPSQFRFGEISVICEGYDYPEDPYILTP